jgi:hypothetical protein
MAPKGLESLARLQMLRGARGVAPVAAQKKGAMEKSLQHFEIARNGDGDFRTAGGALAKAEPGI